MAKITVSATDLKYSISDILNKVFFNSQEAIIERHGKPIAKIVPIDVAEVDTSTIDQKLDAYFGSLKDFPDVKKMRKFRKREVDLDI